LRSWFIALQVRLIRATTAVDRAFALFDRLRSALVLGLASDEVFARYSDWAYGTSSTYLPNTSAFRDELFPWEEKVIDRFFPPPPARILIGGAGGGREAFALARRGYEVVAFDPVQALVEAMAANVPEDTHVETYRASYEDLPLLTPVGGGRSMAHLGEMRPFDAAIMGWGSFTHVRTEEGRVHAIQSFARATRGPVLASFLTRSESAETPTLLGRLRRSLPGSYNREPGNFFGIDFGLFHQFGRAEITGIARQANVEIIYLDLEPQFANWPHAIFVSPSAARSSHRDAMTSATC
jgi:SAM-dependent methyltransferase